MKFLCVFVLLFSSCSYNSHFRAYTSEEISVESQLPRNPIHIITGEEALSPIISPYFHYNLGNSIVGELSESLASDDNSFSWNIGDYSVGADLLFQGLFSSSDVSLGVGVSQINGHTLYATRFGSGSAWRSENFTHRFDTNYHYFTQTYEGSYTINDSLYSIFSSYKDDRRKQDTHAFDLTYTLMHPKTQLFFNYGLGYKVLFHSRSRGSSGSRSWYDTATVGHFTKTAENQRVLYGIRFNFIKSLDYLTASLFLQYDFIMR